MPEAGTDPWLWVAGVLAAANGVQWLAASKDRQQSRADMMTMVPVLTTSVELGKEIRELLRDLVK